MFLLDTDTIIFSLKGNEAVKLNLQKHIDDPIKTTAVTLMELYSCAFVHNLTLVTNNVKHFERIDGLRLANWMD